MAELAELSAPLPSSKNHGLTWLKTYYELTKPERTLANVMTAGAGFLLAARWHIHSGLFIGLLVGLSLLVASACVLNNVLDQGLDAKMPRTKKRALPTGHVSTATALSFAIVLGGLGAMVLAVLVSWLVLLLGAIAYVDYIVVYGWTKRHSVHSTLAGTPAGALPMVAGYVAVSARIDATAIVLFLIMTFWQMAHFYAIAIYRLKDYRDGHIPVMPAVHGVATTRRQLLFYIAAFTLAVIALSVIGSTGYVFAVVMGLLGVAWLWRGLRLRTDDTAWAKAMFFFSLKVLLILCAVLAVGPILP